MVWRTAPNGEAVVVAAAAAKAKAIQIRGLDFPLCLLLCVRRRWTVIAAGGHSASWTQQQQRGKEGAHVPVPVLLEDNRGLRIPSVVVVVVAFVPACLLLSVCPRCSMMIQCCCCCGCDDYYHPLSEGVLPSGIASPLSV